MKRFRSYVELFNESAKVPYLLEYLTPDQEKEFSQYKMSNKARKNTDHFFGPGNDRVEEDIVDSHHDKSEPHRKVERHIGRELSHDEYKSGLTSDKYGRKVKLSKLIKDPGIQQEFARDNTRSGVKAVSKPKMSIVRGVHVAGQTNSAPDNLHPDGHSWGEESCKNVDSGVNRHYLQHEIKHGTVAVFAHDHNGKEIYRATLQPHHNEAGDTAYFLNSEYGIKNAAFTAHAHSVAKRLSGDYKPGVFRIHKKVYDDKAESSDRDMLHPNMTAEHITAALKDSDKDARASAMRHPNATAEHITTALNDKEPIVRSTAINHPNATSEHITTAMKDAVASVRSVAVKHPNATAEHISAGMRDDDEHVRLGAIQHRKATAEHITAALKDDNKLIQRVAIQHPNATAEHISTGMKHENPIVRMLAVQHPSATSEHAVAGLGDPEPRVRQAAIQHNKHITADQISKALKDENDGLRLAAIQHPNATAEHITTALKDENPSVRMVAIKHPNATVEHITTGMKDQDHNVRLYALQSKHATAEHIAAGLKDTDEGVRLAAIDHPNANAEHITTALKDENYYVRFTAIDHSNANAEHARAALKDGDAFIRRTAKQRLASIKNTKQTDKPKNTISLAGGKLKFNESVNVRKISRFKTYMRGGCDV